MFMSRENFSGAPQVAHPLGQNADDLFQKAVLPEMNQGLPKALIQRAAVHFFYCGQAIPDKLLGFPEASFGRRLGRRRRGLRRNLH
jgi:hypothetical protein